MHGVQRRKRICEPRQLSDALDRTAAYVVASGYRGYDPYDALSSPLFRLPGLRTARFPRWASQQVLKRLPFQLRPLLGIQPGYNPVTLALVLQGLVYRAASGHAEPDHATRVTFLVSELRRLASPGYSGLCWGYDFDWEARYATIPAFHPTIVATGLVTNALYELHRIEANPEAAELVAASLPFVEHDLDRTEDEAGVCWGYAPGDNQRVLNATMKGARLCAQGFALTSRGSLLDLASRSTRFVARHQREDGSWPYSVSDARSWSDNFHTGYVLDCFDEYERLTGDAQFAAAKDKGVHFYVRNFFDESGAPKYFAERLHPIDATACGQSFLTLCRFGCVEQAKQLERWAIDHLQLPNGAWKYQIGRWLENRLVYMRWSVAWMYLGLSRLELLLAGQ